MDLKAYRKKNIRTVNAKLEDEADHFPVGYNAAGYTGAFVKKLVRLSGGGDEAGGAIEGIDAAVLLITTLVESSGLKDGGKAVDLKDVDVVESLPAQVLEAIMTAVLEDQSPGND